MWPTKFQQGCVFNVLILLCCVNRYVACLIFFLHVLLQTSLPIFKSKVFTARRRFSDFLGLYEKLSAKQSLHGCIVPPPPEKSVVGEQ